MFVRTCSGYAGEARAASVPAEWLTFVMQGDLCAVIRPEAPAGWRGCAGRLGGPSVPGRGPLPAPAAAFRTAAAGQGLPGASSSFSPCPQFSAFFPLLKTVCDNMSNSNLGLKAFSFFFFLSHNWKSCFLAGAHPALCSLTPPAPHTPVHTCTHHSLRTGILTLPPQCSSRAISQPRVRSCKVTSLK